ncbi:OOP family OmpA-OmpF porin [Sphingomonas sp. SORGH_AS870]|uniref:OmpA family protein n=1 Tax=Sphingomonas sp. SORGH_AS_0870 TaxID=3041801 RepID=UPI00286017AE|nr:OmpA family protein [Sphingomonas sp. SORGH_AS_0870]MDR6144699.1 OOP family OmpA-OmpF porin [Sphingomonas sp. SORGH_AS_0870]
MRVRSGGWMAIIGLAVVLGGCRERTSATASRGTVIEVPVPEPASPARPAEPRSDAVAGRVGPTIGFPQGGAALNAEARAALDRLAGDRAAGQGRIVLRGHSDSEGDDDSNRRMSRKRAEAVRDYLVARGIAATRIEVIALGETRPIAPNAKPDGSDDSAGRARNRRVEIELDPAA